MEYPAEIVGRHVGNDSPKHLWRSAVLAIIGIAAAGISVFVYVLAQRGSVNGDVGQVKVAETAPPATGLGEFPQITEAELQLENILHNEDGQIDLALANWLIAADVPQFQDMTHDDYFKQLDAMTEQVRRDIEMMGPVVRSRGGDPDTPHAQCSIFCGAMIRQRENLTPEESSALYRDANNIFLAGLLRTRRGSCVSMPLIYLVIGRRLGYPVHLVAVGKHYFIRWEEPGYRMNIETTIVGEVAMTPDDSVHLKIEGMTRDQIRGSEMRNLTPREVVGHLFFAREGYWSAQGPQFGKERRHDLSRALHLAPDDPAIQGLHAEVFRRSATRT